MATVYYSSWAFQYFFVPFQISNMSTFLSCSNPGSNIYAEMYAISYRSCYIYRNKNDYLNGIFQYALYISCYYTKNFNFPIVNIRLIISFAFYCGFCSIKTRGGQCTCASLWRVSLARDGARCKVLSVEPRPLQHEHPADSPSLVKLFPHLVRYVTGLEY